MLLEKIQLEPDEKVLIQTRRHWFVIVYQIAILAVLGLVPLIVLLATGGSVFSSGYGAEASFLLLLWLFFLWFGVFNYWTNYYLDVLTITDRRAILVNQKGFFHRNVASFRLERMQDIRVEVQGFIATLLDFGTVSVETAGHSQEEFEATQVPAPSHIKSLILQASDNRITSTPNHDNVSTN